MSKIFKLGDFFGITATQLLLFRPSGFEKLVNCRYTVNINERLYSLVKEIECIRNVLNVDTVRPDYDAIIQPFRDIGYLGINNDMKIGKARGIMARFYKDSLNMCIDELSSKYEDAGEILSIMNENLAIDINDTFPNLKDNTAHKIIDVLFRNVKNIEYYYDMCKTAYLNGQTDDKIICGKSIRDILDLDIENIDSNTKCCYFVNNLCGKIRSCDNKHMINELVDSLIDDISTIMAGYDKHDEKYTTVSELKDILEQVYENMTVDRLNDIINEDLTAEQYESVFENLDDCLIGGMGFNSRDMGDSLLSSISLDGKESWSVDGHDHNEKLDELLRIAYIDARSRKYMSEL